MDRIKVTWFARFACILIAVLATATGCSPAPEPGEVEESPTADRNVPQEVRDAAKAVAGRIGAGRCDAWFWDNEDEDWECSFVGLSRQADLDLLPDGRFSELELVHSLVEVEGALADEAAFIRERCRTDSGIVIELSLRREEHLDAIPELADAWTQDGVVLEFQCPNGVDYEIDARHQSVMRKVDDKQDASAGE